MCVCVRVCVRVYVCYPWLCHINHGLEIGGRIEAVFTFLTATTLDAYMRIDLLCHPLCYIHATVSVVAGHQGIHSLTCSYTCVPYLYVHARCCVCWLAQAWRLCG
jgi:hypothetical protein